MNDKLTIKTEHITAVNFDPFEDGTGGDLYLYLDQTVFENRSEVHLIVLKSDYVDNFYRALNGGINKYITIISDEYCNVTWK